MPKYKVVRTHGSPQSATTDLGCGEPVDLKCFSYEQTSSFLHSQMSAPPLKGIKVVELAGLAPGNIPILKLDELVLITPRRPLRWSPFSRLRRVRSSNRSPQCC